MWNIWLYDHNRLFSFRIVETCWIGRFSQYRSLTILVEIVFMFEHKHKIIFKRFFQSGNLFSSTMFIHQRNECLTLFNTLLNKINIFVLRSSFSKVKNFLSWKIEIGSLLQVLETHSRMAKFNFSSVDELVSYSIKARCNLSGWCEKLFLFHLTDAHLKCLVYFWKYSVLIRCNGQDQDGG